MFTNWHFDRIPQMLGYDPSDPLIFSTALFLMLFFGFLVVYNIFIKNKFARVFLLIIFSLFFYYKAVGLYFLILIVSAIVNFLFGKWIFTSKNFTWRRIYLLLALVVNIGLLFYFKYTNFILQIFNDISNGNIEPLAIFLPVGISFYTFKSLSYVFDIYYEIMEPTNNLWDFTLYVVFFPNILAGPIDRASKFIPQIENNDVFISKEDIGKAAFLIMAGLFKKIVISDYISLNYVDRILDFPLRYTGFENLMAIYGYTLQIYCDFSGYSDMAIGIALLLGYKSMDNFNAPFKATSIADFWRRWHISLSKWLLDYLFKPIQLSIRNLRMYGNVIALLVTFLLCGLWHGAGWNYILWGAIHGFYMSFALFVDKPKQKLYTALKINNTKFLKFFKVLVTFHLVAFSFLIFRLSELQTVADVFSQIFTFFHAEIFMQFIEKLPMIFSLIILGYLLHFMPVKLEEKIKQFIINMPLIGKAVLLAAVIWLVFQFESADIQPFIYFQF